MKLYFVGSSCLLHRKHQESLSLSLTHKHTHAHTHFLVLVLCLLTTLDYISPYIILGWSSFRSWDYLSPSPITIFLPTLQNPIPFYLCICLFIHIIYTHWERVQDLFFFSRGVISLLSFEAKLRQNFFSFSFIFIAFWFLGFCAFAFRDPLL